MTNPVTYLVPGFYLAISEKQHALHFAELPGMMKRATPVRLAIVDSFNHGFEGKIEDLVDAMVKQFDAKPIAVVTFIETLEMAGCL
ncbi:MAG: hypothetical protein QNL94_08160, partial [Halioglobus sp.]